MNEKVKQALIEMINGGYEPVRDSIHDIPEALDEFAANWASIIISIVKE